MMRAILDHPVSTDPDAQRLCMCDHELLTSSCARPSSPRPSENKKNRKPENRNGVALGTKRHADLQLATNACRRFSRKSTSQCWFDKARGRVERKVGGNLIGAYLRFFRGLLAHIQNLPAGKDCRYPSCDYSSASIHVYRRRILPAKNRPSHTPLHDDLW